MWSRSENGFYQIQSGTTLTCCENQNIVESIFFSPAKSGGLSTKTLLNSPDCYGNVCLHLAIKYGHREVGTDNCHSNLILEIDQNNYSSENKLPMTN